MILKIRVVQHKPGVFPCYTKSRFPVEVVCVKDFSIRYEALCAERKIKKWSRNKKDAFIKDNWHLISKFAKKLNFKRNKS